MSDKNLKYLRFRDFLNFDDYGDPEWLTVAWSEKSERGDFFSTSVLVPIEASPYKEYMETDNWPADPTFGRYLLWYDDMAKEWQYEPPSGRFGIDAEPFTFRREYNSDFPSHFELSTEFILAWNLYPNADHTELRHIDDDGEEFPVVRFEGLTENGRPNGRILVSKFHLRLWLMLKGKALLRQFDNRRFTDSTVTFAKGEANEEILIPKRGLGRYSVYTTPDATRMCVTYGACSRFMGFDVTEPFSKEKLQNPKQEWVTLTVSRDEDGNPVEVECHGEQDYRVVSTQARVDYLTPVFFKRAVLKKYMDEPSKYSVEPAILRCFSLWSLYIETDHKKDLVNAYIGDFFRIPYNEQLHWRSFQVPTSESISTTRFARDFEVKFVDIPEDLDPIHKLKILISEFNGAFSSLLGETLFRELPQGDSHHLVSLHLPSVNEQKHFDEFAQSLAKVLCDSINVKALKRIATSVPEELKGSIALFEHVTNADLDLKESLGDLVEALKLCQAIRSRSAAHLKGSDLDKFLRKEDLATTDMKERGLRVVGRLNAALRKAISGIKDKLEASEDK